MKRRNFIFIVLIVMTAFFLSACCKIYCEGNPDLLVLFGGYKAIDADTVYIIQYKKGTQQIADSIAIINNVSPTDTVNHSGLFKNLSFESDWKIVIPSVNKQYLFTNIETQSGKCPCRRTFHYCFSILVKWANANRCRAHFAIKQSPAKLQDLLTFNHSFTADQ